MRDLRVMGLLIGMAFGLGAAMPPAWAQDKPPKAQEESAKPQEKKPAAGAASLTKDSINNADFAALHGGAGPSPALVKMQVLLDRRRASPGVIDGRSGDNVAKAILAFKATRGLPESAEPDEAFWSALTQDQTEPAVIEYEITEKDVSYKFTPDLPKDYAKLAVLPNLNFQTMSEMLAERFHMDERLLNALNPSVDLNKAGSRILVANIMARERISGKIARIEVDKDKGQLLALDDKGALIVAYPATVGSDDMPSPSGDHKIRAVAKQPKYYYDPKKNFQQGKNTEKLTLPSGPNNPVGSIYIALSKPTYGIHGTPDPSKIDKTDSHGCVRLTNWDAEELAQMVRTGIPVHFR